MSNLNTIWEISDDIQVIAADQSQVPPLIGVKQMLRKTVVITSLLLSDLITLVLIFYLSLQMRLNLYPRIADIFPSDTLPDTSEKIWLALGIIIICFVFEGLYRRRLPFWQEAKKMISAITLAFLLLMALVSLMKLGGEVSRTVIVTAYFIALLFLPTSRYLSKTLLSKLGMWKESVIILGANEMGKTIATALVRDQYLGYEIVGFLDSDNNQCDSFNINQQQIPILGNFKDALSLLDKYKVRHVIIASPNLAGSEMAALTNCIQPYTRSVLLVPDLLGVPIVGGEVDYFFDDQILAFKTRNNLASQQNMFFKKLFDICLGTIIFLLLSPLMLGLALIIKLDSKGPAAFKGRRIGRFGQEFDCYKFRTMYIDNDQILEKHLEDNPAARKEWEEYAKLKSHDPRVTRAGKILRRLSLDELPQLINVLRGEMSLVGARPYLPRELEMMGDNADTILLARPGMTGLWQVSGRSEIAFVQRVQLEIWYVRNWSLWLDISLLFRTIPALLDRQGAY